MTTEDRISLFTRIGEDFVVKAIREFYARAERDGIIGHFFLGKDLEHIISMQIVFATALLGGPRNYKGKPLGPAHDVLPLRPPHFGRRQILMREVLDDLGLDAELKEGWLALEEQLKPVIMGAAGKPRGAPHYSGK